MKTIHLLLLYEFLVPSPAKTVIRSNLLEDISSPQAAREGAAATGGKSREKGAIDRQQFLDTPPDLSYSTKLTAEQNQVLKFFHRFSEVLILFWLILIFRPNFFATF
jgi:hypothetical protein